MVPKKIIDGIQIFKIGFKKLAQTFQEKEQKVTDTQKSIKVVKLHLKETWNYNLLNKCASTIQISWRTCKCLVICNKSFLTNNMWPIPKLDWSIN